MFRTWCRADTCNISVGAETAQKNSKQNWRIDGEQPPNLCSCFWGRFGVVGEFASTWQTFKFSCPSNTWAQIQRKRGVRGIERNFGCPASAATPYHLFQIIQISLMMGNILVSQACSFMSAAKDKVLVVKREQQCWMLVEVTDMAVLCLNRPRSRSSRPITRRCRPRRRTL